MPRLQLFNQIPGVQILQPDPLVFALNQSQAVEVRFADGLLWMPPNTVVQVTGTYNTGRLTLSADFDTSPPTLLNQQLRLSQVAIAIALTDAPDGSGDQVLDTAAPQPVTATGTVHWQGEMVDWLLNQNGAAVALALSYQYTYGGQRGFQLTLDQPVTLDRVAVELESGRLRVDLLPDETALLLTLAGDARLVANGTFLNQITTLLGQIFGAGNVPSLDPPAFLFQRKFRLDDNLPGPALEPPRLSLLPDWGAGSPPALDTFEGIDVSLGRPRFTFALPSVNNPLEALALSLQNSTIRLPDLPGWGGLDLTGHLDFESGANGDWTFRFQPVQAGIAHLPDLVRWLLDQIRWPALAFPSLEELVDRLLSLAENEWYLLFRGLLDVPQADFAAALDGLIDGALATLAPLTVEQLFALAFRALQSKGGDLYPLVWQNWFGRFPDASDRLLTLLRAAAKAIDPDPLAVLLDALFGALAPAQLANLLTAVLEWGAEAIETALNAFLKLWLPLLASAIRILDPQVLAGTLWQVIQGASGPLAQFRPPAALPAFQMPLLATADLKLRTDVLLVGTALQGLALGSGWLAGALVFSDTARFFDHLVRPLRDFLAVLFPQFPSVPADKFLSLLLFFFNNAEGDEESETLILQFGRFYFLGVLLALVGAVWNGIRPNHLVPWADLLFKNIEEDNSIKQLRLEPPGKDGRKYLIFSDIHRDEQSDNRGPLNVGSIHHFSGHKELYLNLLEYADDQGYTVIEAGDAEELWFVRDFEQYPADRRSEHLLQSIISWHQAIYDKQKELHGQGRFYRIIGNHDSQLRDGSVRQHLEGAIGEPNKPFTLYDYLIIPQVKTMDDGLLEVVKDLWNANTDQQRVEVLKQALILDRIGLDSDPYTSRKPMIVTHGHQWDFWNCDPNNLVGKLFANTVGVTVDMLNDPLTDMGGINYGGTALVNWRDLLANLFVFNNFPTHAPARRFAHQIQHRRESDRFMIDDVMYIETLPALLSYLAMPLDHVPYNDAGAPGAKRTWTEFRDGLADPGSPIGPLDAFDHLLNQLCIGHTHYPQAAPYFDVEALLTGPLSALIGHIRAQIAERFFGIAPSLNLLKSRYYNSGTAGWHEGVIWAVEINEHGEARLVYWTEDTRIDRPQTMDWQLPRMDDAMRQLLASRKAEVEAYLAELLEALGDSLVEIARNVGTAASMPLAFLAGLAGETGSLDLDVSDFNMLGTADLTADDALRYLTAQRNRITGWLINLFLRLLHRRMQSNPGPAEAFQLAVPLPGAVADALATATGLLGGLSLPGGQSVGSHLTRLACIWLLANHGASIFNRANRADALLRTTYPVAWLVIALVAMLPAAGTAPLPLSAAAATETSNGTVRLKLTVTVN